MFKINKFEIYIVLTAYITTQVFASDPFQEYQSIDQHCQHNDTQYIQQFYSHDYEYTTNTQATYTQWFVNVFLQRAQAKYLYENDFPQEQVQQENLEVYLYQLEQNLYAQLYQFDPSQYEAISQQIMYTTALAHEEIFSLKRQSIQEKFMPDNTPSNNISEACRHDWREHLKKEAFSKLQKDVTAISAQVDHLATEVSDMKTTVTQELQNMQNSIALIAAAVQAQAEGSEIGHKELEEQQRSSDKAQPKKFCVDAYTNTLAILQRRILSHNNEKSPSQPSCQDAWQRAQRLQQNFKTDNSPTQQPSQHKETLSTTTSSYTQSQKDTKTMPHSRAYVAESMVVLARKTHTNTSKNKMRSWASDSDESEEKLLQTGVTKKPLEQKQSPSASEPHSYKNALCEKINRNTKGTLLTVKSSPTTDPKEESKEAARLSFYNMRKAFSKSGISEDLGRHLLHKKFGGAYNGNEKLLEHLQKHLSLEEAINITTGVTDYPAVEKILTVLEEKSGQYARRFNQQHNQPK